MSFDNLRYDIARETASTKLSVLRANKRIFDDVIRTIQADQDALSDPWVRLRVKANTIKALHLPQSESAKRVAEDALAFLHVQERYTTHRSIQQLKRWDERMDVELEFLRHRMKHAVAYADAIEEWLRKDSNDEQSVGVDQGATPTSDPSSQDLPPLPVDPFNPHEYLTSLNVSPVLFDSIASLAKRATTFGSGQLKSTIHPKKIQSAMLTLSRDARVYSADVRKQLVEESSKQMVLDELSGALTQTWTSIATWQWPASGVKEVLQTHMNGKQRSFLCIDIVLAIFLQLVGDTWSAFYATELQTLRDSEGWTFKAELEGAMTAEEEEDVRGQLELINMDDPIGQTSRGESSETGVIAARRKDLKENGGRILGSQTGGYDENPTLHSYEEEPIPSSNKDNDPWTPILDATRPAKTYGDIFRLITTDIVLARLVAPENDLTILHGDLQDFGKSVPHEVLLSVLEFFGMPPAWRQWYTTYLNIPIVQPDGSLQPSTRGTPFGQSCSMLVDELLLVILDIAMASTTGITAHRNHDDFWMWSLEKTDMIKTWAVMQDFTARTGLGWNKTKTSCTVVSGNTTTSNDTQGLPDRLLRWGVLELQPDGKWKVDASLIYEQADAAILDIQLGKARSFLGKIGIVNKYQAYLIRNCGAPTQVNGPDYLKTVRSVLALFEERVTGGQDLTEWVRDRSLEACPLPEATLPDEALQVWPLKLGGFGLQSLRLLALAYEEQLGNDYLTNNVPERQPFGVDLQPRIRVYEKMQRIWATPTLADTFDISRHSDSSLGRWIRSKQALPLLVPFKTYAKWWILHGSSNHATIQDSTLQMGLTPTQVSNKAMQLYGGLLEDQFRSAGPVVAPELVPNYVIQDIESRTKQLFG